MDLIDSFMSPPQDDEEQQALADSLRGRSRAANFFALSSVEDIAKAAQNEQEAIQMGAKTSGVLKRAMADRQQQKEQREFDRQSRALWS